jgi:hypothetical protein
MKAKYIITGLFMAALAWSCTNLDETTYSDMPRDKFLNDPQLLELYSGRAYMTLQNYCVEQSLWTLNLQTADECTVPMNSVGEWGNNTRYIELQQHNFVVSNKLIRTGWEFCFNGIAACNDVISETEKSTLEFAGKERILAEIKVLRAFYYFMAADCWGNVPYSVDPDDKSLPEQKDRAFFFTFIEKEILDNINALDEASANTYGKVTKGVAYTLLAKLYLNAEVWLGTPMWQKAADACLEVINGGRYTIMDNYNSNFSVDNDLSTEGIFVIPYSTIYTSDDDCAFILYLLTLNSTDCANFKITASGWDGFVGQPDFMQSYDAADTRKAETYLFGQQYDANGRPATYESGGAQVPYIIEPVFDESKYVSGRAYNEGAKLSKWTYQTDGMLTSDESMENDFALFRYSDVLYMYAEALLRQGGSAAAAVARDDFQRIRTRAGLEPFTASTLTLETLLAERGHEFALEGWRRNDLIRFGKWTDAWWAKAASPSHTSIYPIPTEMMATNSNLKQNPGY